MVIVKEIIGGFWKGGSSLLNNIFSTILKGGVNPAPSAPESVRREAETFPTLSLGQTIRCKGRRMKKIRKEMK